MLIGKQNNNLSTKYTLRNRISVGCVLLSYGAFIESNAEQANLVEPLEQIIDRMKELLRTRHIDRLRVGECGIEAGFVWSDLITNMERVSDHCSNIAGCVMDRVFEQRRTTAHPIRGELQPLWFHVLTYRLNTGAFQGWS